MGLRTFQLSSAIMPVSFSKSFIDEQRLSVSRFLLSPKYHLTVILTRFSGNSILWFAFQIFACNVANLCHSSYDSETLMNGLFFLALNIICFEFFLLGNLSHLIVSSRVFFIFDFYCLWTGVSAPLVFKGAGSFNGFRFLVLPFAFNFQFWIAFLFAPVLLAVLACCCLVLSILFFLVVVGCFFPVRCLVGLYSIRLGSFVWVHSILYTLTFFCPCSLVVLRVISFIPCLLVLEYACAAPSASMGYSLNSFNGMRWKLCFGVLPVLLPLSGTTNVLFILFVIETFACNVRLCGSYYF